MQPKIIKNNNKNYVVFGVKLDDLYLPIVVDVNDFKLLSKMKKNWKLNNTGSIYCSHTYNGVTKNIYLHDIIMNIKDDGEIIDRPMIHINRIKLDNRRENLLCDTQEKETNKNLKKKKRTISLPKDCGIDPSKIPTYVWYMKPDATHGGRFIVSIGDINWKTTSSRNIPLKDKLEEAKLYLRNLKEGNPHLFEQYSMNGDLNKKGKSLVEEYYTIIHKAGYDYIKKTIDNNTPELIKPT